MGLRQLWRWLLNFGVRETVDPYPFPSQILSCDSTAAISMVQRKGSIRTTRHIELKAFFTQQWSARPEARKVRVGTNEQSADVLQNILLIADPGHSEKLGLRTSGGGVQTFSPPLPALKIFD